MSAAPYAPLLSFCLQVPPPHDRRMLWMTLSTKCLREEQTRVPSHWASSWRYVCGGCERKRCIRVWALVCIRACVCPYVCFYAFSVHALCVHVNVCVYYSTCTCVRVCTLSLCVLLSLHVWVRVHTCTCLSPPPPAHAECHNVYSPFNQFAVHGYCTVEE